jgi:RNA polymerase sigma factor (sigma-70 family)
LKIDDALIKQWEPKITRMISTYKINGLHRDDLAQELRMCILKAAKRYDPERQVTFHTYLHTTMVNTIRTLAAKSKRNLNNEASYLGQVFVNDYLNDDFPAQKLSQEMFLKEPKDWLAIVEVRDLLDSLNFTKPELAFLSLRQAGHSLKEIHTEFETQFPENSLASVREHVRQKFLGSNYPQA